MIGAVLRELRLALVVFVAGYVPALYVAAVVGWSR